MSDKTELDEQAIWREAMKPGPFRTARKIAAMEAIDRARAARAFKVSGVTVNTETGTVTKHAPVKVTLSDPPPVKYHDDDTSDPDVALEHTYWKFDAWRAGRERDAFKAAVRGMRARMVPVGALVEALEWITSQSCRSLTLPDGDGERAAAYKRLERVALDAIPDDEEKENDAEADADPSCRLCGEMAGSRLTRCPGVVRVVLRAEGTDYATNPPPRAARED